MPQKRTKPWGNWPIDQGQIPPGSPCGHWITHLMRQSHTAVEITSNPHWEILDENLSERNGWTVAQFNPA